MDTAPAGTCCSVVELRQYTVYPGERDTLIGLFEREFIESQEAAGMHLIAQFRDLIFPNRYVWLRGFTDMQQRAASLESFYYGPVWKTHRDSANATLVDSDDVLLLRPVPGAGPFPHGRQRPVLGEAPPRPGVYAAEVFPLRRETVEPFARVLINEGLPARAAAAAPAQAVFVTEHADNSFPALPVRTDGPVVAMFTRYTNEESARAHQPALAMAPGWSGVWPTLQSFTTGASQFMILEPTARSEVR